MPEPAVAAGRPIGELLKAAGKGEESGGPDWLGFFDSFLDRRHDMEPVAKAEERSFGSRLFVQSPAPVSGRI